MFFRERRHTVGAGQGRLSQRCQGVNLIVGPALAARSARRQRREGAGEGFGSRTGAGAGASPSASASASRPARVPPSTPEEVEAARRGEWDYGQFK